MCLGKFTKLQDQVKHNFLIIRFPITDYQIWALAVQASVPTRTLVYCQSYSEQQQKLEEHT